MNGDNNQIFDIINRAEKFDNNDLDIMIYKDELWLRANDVAAILGYERPRKAISDNVDEIDRKQLNDLVNTLVLRKCYPKYNKNQLKTIYINESGLYSLILSSKLPTAKKFKKWVTSDLPPKIRKIGQEKYLQQLQEKDQQISKLETHQLKLESFVRNIESLDKKQIFYIATTKNYAIQNRFEYGGVADNKGLKNRLSSYNTGRAEGDLYYFAKIIKCNNYKLMEERVGSILQQFKDKINSRKEMVHLRYNLLSEIVEFICDNYDKEINYINANCQKFLNETIEMEGVVPEPIDLGNYIEISINKNGSKSRSKKIDIADWDDSKIDEIIEEVINRCVSEHKKINYEFSKQKELMELDLSWSLITPYFSSYKGLSKTEWRDRFKNWYFKENPRNMTVKGIKLIAAG